MNVLLLSIGNLKDVNQHEIYTDLLREFRNNGHSVYAVSTYERRVKKNTEFKNEHGINMIIANGENPDILYNIVDNIPFGTRFYSCKK